MGGRGEEEWGGGREGEGVGGGRVPRMLERLDEEMVDL